MQSGKWLAPKIIRCTGVNEKYFPPQNSGMKVADNINTQVKRLKIV